MFSCLGVPAPADILSLPTGPVLSGPSEPQSVDGEFVLDCTAYIMYTNCALYTNMYNYSRYY